MNNTTGRTGGRRATRSRLPGRTITRSFVRRLSILRRRIPRRLPAATQRQTSLSVSLRRATWRMSSVVSFVYRRRRIERARPCAPAAPEIRRSASKDLRNEFGERRWRHGTADKFRYRWQTFATSDINIWVRGLAGLPVFGTGRLVWRGGSGVGHANDVKLRRARLVPKLVTTFAESAITVSF